MIKTRSTRTSKPTALEAFRAEKDRFFGKHAQSPLTPDQKRHFTGLNYFPENSALRIEATVERFPQREEVQMQTTTGGTQTYVRYGQIKFTVDGRAVELTIFSSDSGFFLPFADALAGTETYGAGRYLEPDELGHDKFRVDFNLAYNPYCAYSDRWACPVTPRENRLKVAIRAGEKVFHD